MINNIYFSSSRIIIYIIEIGKWQCGVPNSIHLFRSIIKVLCFVNKQQESFFFWMCYFLKSVFFTLCIVYCLMFCLNLVSYSVVICLNLLNLNWWIHFTCKLTSSWIVLSYVGLGRYTYLAWYSGASPSLGR